MNRNLLIDQVVRQTMVLIAHLATQGGARAPLSDVAEQMFRGLVDELASQRLSHKVIADMFGLALRTYYDRVKRLTESNTMRGRSLWEALFDFVKARQAVTRSVILERFRNDDEAIVKAVLHDLVESGLLLRAAADAFEAARPRRAKTTRFVYYCGENALTEQLAPSRPTDPEPATEDSA